MAQRIEEKHQEAFVSWFSWHYKNYSKLLTIIANGENVGPRRMNKLKKLGLVPGMPDLFLSIARGNFHGLYIEMKQPEGKLQKHQAELHSDLRAQFYKVVVAYSWIEARDAVKDYMSLKNGR